MMMMTIKGIKREGSNPSFRSSIASELTINFMDKKIKNNILPPKGVMEPTSVKGRALSVAAAGNTG